MGHNLYLVLDIKLCILCPDANSETIKNFALSNNERVRQLDIYETIIELTVKPHGGKPLECDRKGFSLVLQASKLQLWTTV